MVSGLITILGTLVLVVLVLALWPLILAAGLILAVVSLFGIAAIVLTFTPLWFSLPATAVAVVCFALFAAPVQRASGRARVRTSTNCRAAIVVAILTALCLLLAIVVGPTAGVGLAVLLVLGHLIVRGANLDAEADRLGLPCRKFLPPSHRV